MIRALAIALVLWFVSYDYEPSPFRLPWKPVKIQGRELWLAYERGATWVIEVTKKDYRPYEAVGVPQPGQEKSIRVKPIGKKRYLNFSDAESALNKHRAAEARVVRSRRTEK